MENEYLRTDKLPFFWCPGCGNGPVLHSILRNMDERHLDLQQTVVATGIGCWGKADDYVKTNTFHGTHGRALAFSTGIKLANPELTVFTLMGDGDGITIGGNHLIHAARRNVDLVAIMVNNLNYGMTGGQYSGTTPEGYRTKTSVYGHLERPFDVCDVVRSAGGSFVARATIYNKAQLDQLIGQAIDHKGFSFVEVIAPCPTHFGRNNKMASPAELGKWIQARTCSVEEAKNMSSEELEGKFVTGVFANRDLEDYSTRYARLISKLEGEPME